MQLRRNRAGKFEGMAAALRPLRLPGFPNLGLAYLVNEFGNWLGEIALAILVFDQTGSPMATAALFCGMHFAPAVLGPPLVARLESAPVRFSLPGLYAAEAVAFAVLALIAEDFSLIAVLALATFDGSIASAARALTRTAATAILAPAGQLREGNALLNVAFTVGAAGGPAIAGIVVAAAGVPTALFADAVSFMAVAALLLVARRLELPEPEEPGASWTERLRRGLSYVRERPALRRLLGAQALAFVFFALVIPIEVVFVKETLDGGDAGYGALLASWGAGMVAGSLTFAALRRVPLAALLAVSTLAIGAAYLGTSVSPTLVVACAASFVGGLGNGVQWIALVTAVQELTRAAYQARVLALLEALASAMPGVGFLLGGAIAVLSSPRLSYAVAGAGVLVVLALATARLRDADWEAELEQGEPRDGIELGRRQADALLADRQRRIAELSDSIAHTEGVVAQLVETELVRTSFGRLRRALSDAADRVTEGVNAPPMPSPPPAPPHKPAVFASAVPQVPPDTPAPPADDSTPAEEPAPEDRSADRAWVEARQAAIQMAAAGNTRAQVEAQLRGFLQLADPTPLLDQVFGTGTAGEARVAWAIAPSTPTWQPEPPGG